MGKYKTVFLTEKDDQVKALCKVLGAVQKGRWQPAFNEQEGIVIVPLKGHVLVQAEPEEYGEQYKGFGEDKIYVFPKERKLKPRKDIMDQIKRAVKYLKEAEEIIVATDFDAEGAAIGYNMLKYSGTLDKFKKMIPMGSTHPDALRKAIEQEEVPFWRLADSGNTRAFIDWAEGMSLSRAISWYLGDKGKIKLPFGGVKAPILYIVVLREMERLKHKVSYYWTVKATATTENGDSFPVTIEYKNEDGKWSAKFESEEEAKEAIEALKEKEISISSFSRQKKKTPPPKLFELSSLESEIGNALKIRPKEVDQYAQKLYDYPISIQTYPRTDIPYLKEEEYKEVPKILNVLSDAKVIDHDIIDDILRGPIPKRKSVFDSSKVVAHGAIVPTGSPDTKKWYQSGDLSKKEKAVFEAVAKRYVANFMPDYEYEGVSGRTESITTNEGESISASFSEHVPMYAGWKKIYEEDIEEKISSYKKIISEKTKKGTKLNLSRFRVEKKETKPKPFYTVVTLTEACAKVAKLFPENPEIKKYLGEEGIGTVATRSTIIEQLMDKEYNRGEPFLVLEKQGSKEVVRATKKALHYVKYLPDSLVSPIKRAMLSKKLKMIERGEIDSEKVIDEYRESVKKDIETIKKIYEKQGPVIAKAFGVDGSSKKKRESLGECPLCGGDVVESKRSYICSNSKFTKTEDGKIKNEGCQYIIFKNALERFGKKEITPSEVKRVLQKGKIKVKLKSNKTGNPYDAIVVIDKKYGVKVDFNAFEKLNKKSQG